MRKMPHTFIRECKDSKKIRYIIGYWFYFDLPAKKSCTVVCPLAILPKRGALMNTDISCKQLMKHDECVVWRCKDIKFL